MKENRWTFEKARDYVKSMRSSIKPNEGNSFPVFSDHLQGFVNQLLTFEKEIQTQ